MTTLEAARQGLITDLMQQAAAVEGIDPELLRQRIADGTAIICHNNRRANGVPLAVGLGMRTKVNANIGTSQDDKSIDKELEKARESLERELSINPDNYDALCTLGDYYLNGGKYDKAITYYSKVASMEPRDSIDKLAQKKLKQLQGSQGR